MYRLLIAAGLSLAIFAPLPAAADAHGEASWYPSRWGADDTLGAINHLTPELALRAVRLVKTGKSYPLGVVTGWNSPAYPPRSYSLTVLQPGDGTGSVLASNGATGNDDLLITWMGIGSQIDGLGHMGENHVYYNGNRARDFVTTRGLTRFGTHELPPIVTRGILLDMTRQLGQDPLPAGTAFNSADIKAAERRAGVNIGTGDVVLFHTGWLNAHGDNMKIEWGEPGIGEDGARYLSSRGVVAVGADTWALEAVPHERDGVAFPVHVHFLAHNGIYILENMNTTELAADGATEFLFVLGQPRLEGTVQAIINPVAIR